ncbi:MAG: hypothetical protein GX448_01645 [Planctomycetes bacterium]|nr:hypothetical protein [Planctomycetota bacterium]
MSATDDRLEILIGKLLDGDISPTERKTLDRQLEQDGHARELLEQMRVLHECGREIVERQVQQGGAAPADVFERAWRQSRGSIRGRILRIGGLPRFAVGLAAGLLLGVVLHFVSSGDIQSPINDGRVATAPERPPVETANLDESWRKLQPRTPDQVTRQVEWYGFTDPAGNQWLIEGYREGVVKPASYHGGL